MVVAISWPSNLLYLLLLPAVYQPLAGEEELEDRGPCRASAGEVVGQALWRMVTNAQWVYEKRSG